MLTNLFCTATSTAERAPSGISMLPIIIILAILGIFLYFLPTFIAFKRKHLNKVPILVVNIFLGWTFLGWVVALVWSLSNSSSGNN